MTFVTYLCGLGFIHLGWLAYRLDAWVDIWVLCSSVYILSSTECMYIDFAMNGMIRPRLVYS